MSNETMTDAQREELIAFLDGSGQMDGVWFGEKHPRERGAYWWRKHLARLRGEAVQSEQAVAWYTEDHLTDKSATTYSPKVADMWRNKGWPVHPLYDRPQPAIAGDAVRALPAKWLSDMPKPSGDYEQGYADGKRHAGRDLEAALSAAPAAPAGMDPPVDQQRDMLAQAIRDAAVKAGIAHADAPMTGPMLLMLCEDLANAATPAPVAGDAVAWMVFTSADDTHTTTDPREADDARDDGYEVRPLVFGDRSQADALSQDHASQGAAAGVPEGWQLVPLKPTVEMGLAGLSAPSDLGSKWAAMLAAAPSAPTQGAEREVS